MSEFKVGDLVILVAGDVEFFGEVVGYDSAGKKVEVSRLKKTNKQEGRIWEFVGDDEWSSIDPKFVKTHISLGSEASRKSVVAAWKTLGFIAAADGITFCRVEDEDETTLAIGDYEDDSEEDDEDTASTNPSMHGYASDGFVVPDDEGSDFEFANPDELDDDAAKFVRETHQAVHDYNNWNPDDKQGKGIKKFIDNMDVKATMDTDNKRFAAGKECIRTDKPPIKKRKVEK